MRSSCEEQRWLVQRLVQRWLVLPLRSLKQQVEVKVWPELFGYPGRSLLFASLSESCLQPSGKQISHCVQLQELGRGEMLGTEPRSPNSRPQLQSQNTTPLSELGTEPRGPGSQSPDLTNMLYTSQLRREARSPSSQPLL